MKKLRILNALVITFSMLLTSVSTVMAFPPLPSGFYGTVKINGANIPIGTIVSARINGIEYASRAAFVNGVDTVYFFDVPGDDSSTPAVKEGGVQGEVVAFQIGSALASQTATWISGTNVNLNLSVITPVCYVLTLSHTGQGSDPVAAPVNSSGCAAGQYIAGASISLNGAIPTSGWQIGSWVGTNNNASNASSNMVTMPASASMASVNYVISPKLTPTVTASGGPFTYDGVPHAATVTGSVAGTVSNVKYNGSATVPTHAGTYAVTANFVPVDAISYNSLTDAAAGSIIINKATPTLAVTNSPVTFNASPQAAAVIGSVEGIVSNILTGGLVAQTGIGTYAVTADFVPNDAVNYNSLTGAPAGNFVINSGSGGLGLGGDTTGVFRPSNGVIFLKNANTTGFADIALNYGLGGDYPVTGDWNGDGTDTIGIYRNGVFYLRNSNTIGFADIVFAFGQPGDQPIAGDWDGDGTDTIGIYRSSAITFMLRNSNSAGAFDTSFLLGLPGDVGIVGDWDGDGLDTTGVFRPSNGVIFLKNANTSGFAEVALNYGLAGDQPVAGDWDNDGIDTIGVYRNGQFFLRNSNTIGFANLVFALGIPGDMPIVGNWDGIP